jgi:hypothetical protein
MHCCDAHYVKSKEINDETINKLNMIQLRPLQIEGLPSTRKCSITKQEIQASVIICNLTLYGFSINGFLHKTSAMMHQVIAIAQYMNIEHEHEHHRELSSMMLVTDIGSKVFPGKRCLM